MEISVQNEHAKEISSCYNTPVIKQSVNCGRSKNLPGSSLVLKVNKVCV